MRFISLDLENNQPSGRTTQIGAAFFDTDSKTPFKPVKELSIFIAPGEPLNWYFPLEGNKDASTLGELLGSDWLDNWSSRIVSREEGLAQFWSELGSSGFGKKIIQWGKGDLAALLSESKELGIRYPSGLKDLNLKRVYDMLGRPALKQDGGLGGLQKAVLDSGLEFQGRPHDALVDAINTGRLFIHFYRMLEGAGKFKNHLGG